MGRWSGAPPEQAYGRVTDAGRFAALHPFARDLLDDLQARYAVTRQLRTEPDVHGSMPAQVIRLVPVDPAAAPLEVVCTAFPGLLLRVGRTLDVPVPACGCDACDETTGDSIERIEHLVRALTSDGFGERLHHHADDGQWWLEHWSGSSATAPSGGGGTVVGRRRVGEIHALLPDRGIQWLAWTERPAT